MEKWSWPTLRHYPDIFMVGLRKTTKYLGQDSQPRDPDLNTGPPNMKPEC